jgi:hypothetical protein
MDPDLALRQAQVLREYSHALSEASGSTATLSRRPQGVQPRSLGGLREYSHALSEASW